MSHVIAVILALALSFILGKAALQKYADAQLDKYAFKSEEACRKAVRDRLVDSCYWRADGRDAMALPRTETKGAR